MKLSFTKMQGCANDYIYLDCRASGEPADIAALAQRLSARHFSVGADGIICICAPVTPGADGRMRIFNADGSEAQMCGNGVRCVAEWLYTHGVEKPVLTIDTNSGVKRISRQGAQLWQVEMGAYSTLPTDLPAIHMGEGPLVDQPLTVEGKVWKVTCISVGNPHCVTVVEDVDSLKLEAIGPAFDRAGHLPRRAGYPCAAARRGAGHPGAAGQAAADDRQRCHGVRGSCGSLTSSPSPSLLCNATSPKGRGNCGSTVSFCWRRHCIGSPFGRAGREAA